MRPTTQRFKDSIRYSHAVYTTCKLTFPSGQVVTVDVIGGEVTIDRTALIRRTGRVNLPWSTQTAADLGVDLQTLPLGGYAELQSGVRYPDGDTELCLLGRLRVESVTWKTTDAAAGLELADRMAQVRDEPFTAPYVPPAGAGVTRNGTLTDDSAVVTGLSTTADLLVGQSISGVGIPQNTVIQTINSGTQITMNRPANISASKNYEGAPGNPILTQISDTSDLSVGMTVSDPGDIPAGAVIIRIDGAHEIAINPPPTGTSHGDLATFTAPATASLTFGQGRRIADAAIEIAQQVFGTTIAYRKLHDPAIILADVYYGQNRADALAELAKAAGGEAYFDHNGDFIFDVPAGSTASVWTVDTGATGVMVDTDESLNRTGVYNGVLVTGQQTAVDAPVAALVTDNNPTSPTRWGGPFGKVARVETNSAIQNTAQATDAATALLDARIGLTRALTVTQAPNPSLEAGDVVTIAFPDGRTEQHVLDAVRVDLAGLASQSLVTHAVDQLVGTLQARTANYGYHAGDAAWLELAAAQVTA